MVLEVFCIVFVLLFVLFYEIVVKIIFSGYMILKDMFVVINLWVVNYDLCVF